MLISIIYNSFLADLAAGLSRNNLTAATHQWKIIEQYVNISQMLFLPDFFTHHPTTI